MQAPRKAFVLYPQSNHQVKEYFVKSGRLAGALCVSLLAMAAHAAPPVPSTQKAPTLQFIPFEAVVKFKGGTVHRMAAGESLQSVSTPLRLGLVKADASTRTASSDPTAATLALVRQLRARSDVEYAHPNYLFQLSATANDPLYPQQWHYPPIQLPQAWDITMGSANVRIGVLDTGRTTHPDLASKWHVEEYNAAAPGTSAMDTANWRHGTHVASIAGGATNNGIGTAGVCRNCKLVNIKVASATGQLSMTSVIRGIDWAISKNVQVLNMSFESQQPCSSPNATAVREAVARAIANGVNVVAAAGNQASPVTNTTPATCAGVVSVAATAPGNVLAPYSNYGSVTLAAPGGGGVHQPPYSGYGMGVGCPDDPGSSFYPYSEGVLAAWTTTPASGNAHCYRYLSGTSMSAPHVAGAIGLMLSVNPTLRPAQVKQLLTGSASPLPACNGQCGAGLLNVAAAVSNARNVSTGPCGAGMTRSCVIDAIGQYRKSDGSLIESVLAYGQVWTFDQYGQAAGPARDLRSRPHYASGPCAYAPAGADCVIDSATTLDYPGFGTMDSVTAYGRYWNFDGAGNGLGGNGSSLRSVPRYANGPCAYAAANVDCRFDTRVLIDAPQWGGLIESISAYGRFWNFDAAGNPLAGSGSDVRTVARYANGPCAYAAVGSSCRFDSRELQLVPGQGIIETITAYGRYFVWDEFGNPMPGNGQTLASVARFR